jgi:hypothetical protein
VSSEGDYEYLGLYPEVSGRRSPPDDPRFHEDGEADSACDIRREVQSMITTGVKLGKKRRRKKLRRQEKCLFLNGIRSLDIMDLYARSGVELVVMKIDNIQKYALMCLNCG